MSDIIMLNSINASEATSPRAGSKRVDKVAFPDAPQPGSNRTPTTIPNVEHLLSAVGIKPQYNEITKEMKLNGREGHALTANDVTSIAVFNGLNQNLVLQYIPDIAQRNPCNPVRDWIQSVAWDGKDRLQDLYATVRVADEYPATLKNILLYRWLVSATAAALKPQGFKARGVLTLQGPQGCGKTSWIGALVSNQGLRDTVVRLDHHLDAGNKDSIIGAIANWITEIGELDSSFKRDIGKIKGFLTLDRDILRRPYGRGEVEFQRRTVFAATVNDYHFLLDPTGNNRWWTIAVESLNFKHDIDMQQLFAQLALDFDAGVEWWLTPEEEKQLNAYNLQHRSVSVVKERILEAINLEALADAPRQAMTAIEVLTLSGINHPTNAQCKECGSVLRELFGPPRRIQGRDRWRVPLKATTGHDFNRKPPPPEDDF